MMANMEEAKIANPEKKLTDLMEQQETIAVKAH